MFDDRMFSRVIDQVSDSRMAIFVGRNDTGKSTLIKNISHELDVSIVDSDIGQSDIGPPTVVSLGEKRGGKYVPVDGYFCGSTTPSGHFLQLITGTVRMHARAKRRPVLINTTGLAAGDIGRMVKTQKIDALVPDLIVGISNGSELRYLDAFSHTGARVLHLPINEKVKPKSKAERDYLRKKAFAEHFYGAAKMTCPFEKFAAERLLLFNGIEQSDLSLFDRYSVTYFEVSGHEAVAIAEEKITNIEQLMKDYDLDLLHVHSPHDFADLLVGLVNGRGVFAGLGIIDAIDFRQRTLTVFTPASSFSVLQFGSIKLDPHSFENLGPFRARTLRA